MRKCTLWAWESQLETVNNNFLFRRIGFGVFDFRGNAFLENWSRVLGYTHRHTAGFPQNIILPSIFPSICHGSLDLIQKSSCNSFSFPRHPKSSSPVRRCESFSPYNSLLFRRCLGERKLLKKVFGCIGLGHFPLSKCIPDPVPAAQVLVSPGVPARGMIIVVRQGTIWCVEAGVVWFTWVFVCGGRCMSWRS